ncbi:alpha/beta fold hydrolase [Brevibacillus sp. NRS-1366]|uniref:alpha/beta fold hydrolase n=1 Tax=Brevibacillus sp. NRS-1366 TaxID=3233899 RepID=UPI003D1FC917
MKRVKGLGQTGFVTVKEADIYYEIAGKGNSIVFLHGAPLDSRMWEPQMDALSKQFQVIRFDLRGLGKTKDPGFPFTLYEDIHSLLQTLQIEKASFVGASFGSYVGVEFALAYPEMVERLVLVCPGGFEPPSEDRQQWFKKMTEAFHHGNIEEALDINLHLLLDGPEQQKGRVQERREWLNEIFREIFSQSAAQGNKPTWLEPDPRGRLEEVWVPTLIVSGQLDHPDFIRTAERLASQISHAKHVMLHNSAHFPNIDSPNEMNELIERFCSADILSK